MRKILKAPKVSYNPSTMSDFNGDMKALCLRRKQDNRPNRTGYPTFYGAYKAIRSMAKYAAFGDYGLLSAITQYFVTKKIPFRKLDIARTMFRYSEEFGGQLRGRKSLVKTILDSAPEGGSSSSYASF